jgi:hypothetical protein
VRDNIVCGALALAIVRLLVSVVWIWVLQDNVPGVQQTGEEAETAECDVDERVARTDTALDPDYVLYQRGSLYSERHNSSFSCGCLEQANTYLR